MPKLKDTHRYLIAGFTAITTFLLLAYFAPLVVMGGFLFLLFTIMSLAIGYIIIDSYDRWREDNDKNKSRKKAPSSKDAQQNSQISM